MNKVKYKRTLLFFALLVICLGIAFSQIRYQNSGVSKAIGKVGNGKLINPYLIKYKGANFKYFSPISYYVLDMGYTHSKLYYTVIDAYKECEITCPGVKFRLMECSKKRGGDPLLHLSHQNGLSVDFMIPKQKNEKQFKWFDRMGLFHYLLNANSSGYITQKVTLDFETMARHILALDNAAKKNGLQVQKVILQIDLKDNFYETTSGKKVKSRGIYFAKSLKPVVDKMHDDHYHVDFKEF